MGWTAVSGNYGAAFKPNDAVSLEKPLYANFSALLHYLFRKYAVPALLVTNKSIFLDERATIISAQL